MLTSLTKTITLPVQTSVYQDKHLAAGKKMFGVHWEFDSVTV